MIPAWQAHANLSMISESTNNCEGQVIDTYQGSTEIICRNLTTDPFLPFPASSCGLAWPQLLADFPP
jgi:hypothetical protein